MQVHQFRNRGETKFCICAAAGDLLADGPDLRGSEGAQFRSSWEGGASWEITGLQREDLRIFKNMT